MYQIVTIALEYRDLHSARCVPLGSLAGKEATQYAVVPLSGITTGRPHRTDSVHGANKASRCEDKIAYLPSQETRSPLLHSSIR